MRDKGKQKLAHTFSRVTVVIKFVTIGQPGETKQHSKEVDLDKSSFLTVPNFNLFTNFHEFYVNIFILFDSCCWPPQFVFSCKTPTNSGCVF